MHNKDQINTSQLFMKANRFLRVKQLVAIALMGAVVFILIGVGRTSATNCGQTVTA